MNSKTQVNKIGLEKDENFHLSGKQKWRVFISENREKIFPILHMFSLVNK